jgi:twinkle protein
MGIPKEQSRFLRHEACEHCGSSDGKSVWSDGHTWCFVCETHQNGSGDDEIVLDIPAFTKPKTKPTESVLEAFTGVFQAIADRNITLDTCKHYSVTSNDKQHFYPYGAGSKIRDITNKEFHWRGKAEHDLFGMDKFTSGGKAVTIVEGELDALAAYQMLGSKYAVVSVKNGASGALKDCQKAYEWLDKFESIVICFDSDEPGLKASKAVAELFGNKAKIFKHAQEFKDACDYLKANKSAQFVQDWWRAEQFVPDGIVTGATLYEEVMKPLSKANAHYPFAGLDAVTGGIREQEMVVVTAGSGLGKSQFLREIIWSLLSTTSDKIGLMFLEESVRRTGLSIMSLAINKPLHLAETVATDDEKQKAFDLTLGTDRLYLYDSFGSNTIENIISRVRYMAKALECKYIMIDHVSIIISGQDNGDERKALDEIMTKLRMLVQETGITLFVVSHLRRPEGNRGHEEGAATSLAQLRGSGSIGQLADMVLGLERHAQAEDPIERNTTRVRVIKNRYSGETGPACAVLYDKYTGRMTEMRETL